MYQKSWGVLLAEQSHRMVLRKIFAQVLTGEEQVVSCLVQPLLRWHTNQWQRSVGASSLLVLSLGESASLYIGAARVRHGTELGWGGGFLLVCIWLSILTVVSVKLPSLCPCDTWVYLPPLSSKPNKSLQDAGHTSVTIPAASQMSKEEEHCHIYSPNTTRWSNCCCWDRMERPQCVCVWGGGGAQCMSHPVHRTLPYRPRRLKCLLVHTMHAAQVQTRSFLPSFLPSSRTTNCGIFCMQLLSVLKLKVSHSKEFTCKLSSSRKGSVYQRQLC